MLEFSGLDELIEHYDVSEKELQRGLRNAVNAAGSKAQQKSLKAILKRVKLKKDRVKQGMYLQRSKEKDLTARLKVRTRKIALKAFEPDIQASGPRGTLTANIGEGNRTFGDGVFINPLAKSGNPLTLRRTTQFARPLRMAFGPSLSELLDHDVVDIKQQVMDELKKIIQVKVLAQIKRRKG